MRIRDIAKMAGVSPSTVSMVLNNKHGISEETRKKVLDVAKASGYNSKKRGQLSANNINGQIRFIKYKREGFLVERNGDFISNVIDGVEFTASERSFNLSFSNVLCTELQEMIDSINKQDTDGVIFLGTEFDSASAHLLKAIKAPVVILDNQFKNKDFDAVVMDNEAGVFMAIEYLKSLGHTEIGHIKSTIRIDNFIAREAGFKAALDQLELEYNQNFICESVPNIDKSYEMMKEYLKAAKTLPTAFFADNDIIAIGAIRALKEEKIKVPEDISVIGFDDLQISGVVEPPLSTIKIYKMTMGQQAVTRLIDKISSGADEKTKILVGPKLIVRKSTCEPLKKK